jgi:hypothetical protein
MCWVVVISTVISVMEHFALLEECVPLAVAVMVSVVAQLKLCNGTIF